MESATAEKQKKDATEVLDLKNMIGGEFVDPAEGKTEDVINPASGLSRTLSHDRPKSLYAKSTPSATAANPLTVRSIGVRASGGVRHVQQRSSERLTKWKN